MTTIATDGKTMAGDGQSETQRTIMTWTREKVLRLSDGSLFGSSGDSSSAKQMARWLIEGGAKPKLKGVGALRLMPDGALFYINEDLEPVAVNVPSAVGSGMDFAIGAMEHGASPEKAVGIAAKRDPGTGGKITVLRL